MRRALSQTEPACADAEPDLVRPICQNGANASPALPEYCLPGFVRTPYYARPGAGVRDDFDKLRVAAPQLRRIGYHVLTIVENDGVLIC